MLIKYLKTATEPLNRLTPGYVAALISGYGLVGANIVVQILLVPLYLQTLGKSEFGFLMFVLSIVNFSAFGIGWMSGGSVRVLGEFFARNDGSAFRRAYFQMRVVFWIYSALAAILILSVGGWPGSPLAVRFADIGEQTVQHTMLALALYLVVYYDFTASRHALTAMGRQSTANNATVLSLVVFALFVVPWLTIFDGGLAGVVVGLAAGAVIARLVVARYVSRGLRALKASEEPYDGRRVLGFFLGRRGMGYALYGALLLVLQSDVIIVGWIGGAAVAAEFVLIWKVAEVAALMLWRIPETLQPYIVHLDTRGERDNLSRIYRGVLKRCAVLGACAGIFYALLGPLIVELWVGEAEAPKEPVAFVLAGLAIFWLVMARAPAVFAYSMVRLKALVAILALEVVCKLVGTILLFPKMGYLAPLFAFTLVHVFGIALLYQWLGREMFGRGTKASGASHG